MVVCVYGRAAAPFVEPVVRAICRAAPAGAIRPLAIEAALQDPGLCAGVHRVYVLPFDAPPQSGAGAVIRQLFPRAEIAVGFAAQDLCWDRLAVQQRLHDRGLPVPETLVSSDPAEAAEFVLRHGVALLRERHAYGGQGNLAVWCEADQLWADGGGKLGKDR